MPPAAHPAAEIEAALQQQQWTRALQLSERLLARSPRNLQGLLGRARCNVFLSRLRDADADLDELVRLAPTDPLVLLMLGMVHHKLGRSDQAVAVLSGLLDRKPYNRIEVAAALAETLYVTQRREELAELMRRDDVWGNDPRALLFRARVLESTDRDAAIAMLEGSVRGNFPPVLQRVNGFAAVELLDKSGRYREAFDLAALVHARFTPRFDLEGLLQPIREQRQLLARGAAWFRPRAEPVQGVAMVVSLPRSGTSLLEQMLDAHPSISGIGEYEGMKLMEESLVATGLWPWGLGSLEAGAAAELQRRYLRGAVAGRREGTGWVLDKGLHTWRLLPAVAAILPGAVCLNVERDPRDTAISLFLSHFHGESNGWTASLGSIRRLIEAERSILPEALGMLGIAHEAIVYEDLVADPAGHARRCLDRMGLPMVDQVTQPERNRRTVLTLSHAQVRRPINNRSIGRWRNYAWAFDDGWNELAARHDARRVHKADQDASAVQQ
jgi:tetratricopeptide (TPR) repeat protein